MPTAGTAGLANGALIVSGPSHGMRVQKRQPTQLRDPALTPAAEALRGELQHRFRMALDDLDGVDREIILLRHFEQLSNSEAAQALGLSEAAAGMRHLRALRRLRAILGEAPSLC